MSWYGLVLPGLVLNYFGQAALLATDASAVESPFYRLAPTWAVTPLAVLATVATVIASQALISGAFSLTAQAVQLDYLPRVALRHTSAHHIGQVYVPIVNWLLMIGCISLVIGFGSSASLASAYGIAVTTTMLITTLLFYRVARDRWSWSVARTLAVVLPIGAVDLVFFAANLPKIPTGGWFPLLVGLVLVLVMTTWRRGRQLVAAHIRRGEVPIGDVVAHALDTHAARVPGTAVYLFKDAGVGPPALMSNLRHNKVLHQHTLLVAIHTADVPRISKLHRVQHERIGPGIHQVHLYFGFMESPDVPTALALIDIPGFRFDPNDTTYLLGRELVTATRTPGMHPLREHLFAAMNRSSASAARFFGLPTERVFEVGTQVDI